MKNHKLIVALLFGSWIVILFYIYIPDMKRLKVQKQIHQPESKINIVLTSCRQNLTAVPQNTLTLIKSILLYRPEVVFHIFTEKIDETEAKIADFANSNGLDMANFHNQFQILPVQLPPMWRSKQVQREKHCVAQYLFAAEMLPASIEKVIKLDTDAIVLSDIQNLFSQFEKFSETQIMAAVSDGSDVALYDIFPNGPPFPVYRPYFNAGILLMHLDRIRAMNFAQMLTNISEKYGPLLKLGEQDILNIFFSNRRELMYPLPCSYNFRSEHCLLKGEMCQSAIEEGVSLLHGSSRIFERNENRRKQSRNGYNARRRPDCKDPLYKDFVVVVGAGYFFYIKRILKSLNTSAYRWCAHKSARSFALIQDAFADYNLKQHDKKALLATIRQKLAEIMDTEPEYSCGKESYLLKAFQHSMHISELQ